LTAASGTLRAGTPDAPLFTPASWPDHVPTFRWTTWAGIRSGVTKTDSANGPHFAVVVPGGVNMDALRRTLAGLGRRHRILTARLVDTGDGPGFTGFDRTPVALDTDRAGGDPGQRAASACWTPFDLEAGPLSRAFVTPTGDGDDILGLVVHHMAADALSVAVLRHETAKLYDLCLRAPDVSVPPSALQYPDYLLALDAWFAGEGGRSAKAYWQKRLAHPPRLELPTPAGGRRGVMHRFEIVGQAWRRTQDLARDLKVSKFILLLAAQFAALTRITAADDLVIGAVTTGREHPSLQRTVGYFADRTYYRLAPSPSWSFADLVDHARREIAEAARRQYYRSDRIKAALAEDGHVLVAPCFNFRPRLPVGEAQPPDQWRAFAVSPPQVRTMPSDDIPYWLEAVEDVDRLACALRFPGDEAPGLAEALVTLLERAADDPRRRLDDLL
jgi:hypothetical protein